MGLVLGLGSLLAGCSYTSVVPPAQPVCALPTTVSYKTNVLPILTLNCRNSCHNPQLLQGNFNMDDFTQVQYWATTENGKTGIPWMLGNIRHDPGFNNMPQVGDKLDDCEIATIKAWIDAGAPNN